MTMTAESTPQMDSPRAGDQERTTSGVHDAHEKMPAGEGEEKPVREKLRDAAISSQRGSQSPSSSDAEMGQYTPQEDDSPPVKQGAANGRTKLARKRSLEVEESKDTRDVSNLDAPTTPSSGTHARKKADTRTSKQNLPSSDKEDHSSPTTPKSGSDQQHDSSILSPRRKRSADEMGSDTSRLPKVAATEEAQKARKSVDGDRPTLTDGAPDSTSDMKSNKATAPPSTAKIGGFGSASGASPFLTFGAQSNTKSSAFGASTPSSAGTTTTPANLSFSNSKSPFASVSSANIKPSPFGASSSPFGSTARVSTFAASNGDFPVAPVTRAKIGAFGTAPSSGLAAGAFGSADRVGNTFASANGGISTSSKASRPFGAPAAEKSTKAENSEDEATEEENSNAGDEVKDAAEPKDDAEASRYEIIEDATTGEEDEKTIFMIPRAKLYKYDGGGWKERGVGGVKVNIKRGNSPPSDSDDQDSEVEEDELQADSSAAVAQALKSTGGDETEKSQIKVNEQAKESSVQARILMRAMATHRVILNAPLIKLLPVGDPHDLAKPPQGKTMALIVPDETEPMKMAKYLIKIAREEELEKLYWQVKDVQNSL